ncbi:MAG: dTMP kinase [Bacteroidales bacterium]|nr:dTMP kinase [Bacteroidales bacterium]MCL2133483.1 dTMP kinase [Bacteroidales bacterium]
MFIVLEGLDGAGKSTQMRLLQSFLTKNNVQSELMHFPRFDAPIFGELIAKFLRGDLGDIQTVDPYIVGLLFAGDRNNAAPIIRSWISAGKCVLLDRYVYSNIAFQCAKLPPTERPALRQWILQMEYDYFGIPQPDLTLFLDVPLSHVEEKLSEDRQGEDRSYLQGKKDIHEESLNLQEQVRAVYLEQSTQDPKFHVINCGDGFKILPASSIFEKIQSHIIPLIS